MKLVENWRVILLRSYSMQAQIAGLLVLIAPEVYFALTGVDTDPGYWWSLGLALLIFGTFGRLVPQNTAAGARWWPVPLLVCAAIVYGLAGDGWRLGADQGVQISQAPPVAAQQIAEVAPADPEVEFLEIALPFVAKWEGLRTEAYLDPVGVATVCFGHTKGVKLGDRYTAEECHAMLRDELLEYRAGLHRYFTPDTIRTRLPAERDAAFGSFAFNVGIAGAGKSTATRRLNAGNIAGACEALTWWNKAGGRVFRGLVNRRAGEAGLCMVGVV
jgi:GH24 family phage-related lysozyme (muramidase)